MPGRWHAPPARPRASPRSDIVPPTPTGQGPHTDVAAHHPIRPANATPACSTRRATAPRTDTSSTPQPTPRTPAPHSQEQTDPPHTPSIRVLHSPLDPESRE